MYTRENFEYCWGNWFGSYSDYSLYSIFTNALKQARRFKEMIVMKFMMKMAAMTTMMAGPRTVGLGSFSPVQRLDERSEARVTIKNISTRAEQHTQEQSAAYTIIFCNRGRISKDWYVPIRSFVDIPNGTFVDGQTVQHRNRYTRTPATQATSR
jgi:hypothetical protein